jgi:quinol monooxygenase YgiN
MNAPPRSPWREPGVIAVSTVLARKEFPMVTRIWHGATPASKSDEYLNLMRTVAIPDYRSTPGNNGAYAPRRMEGDTAHFLMVTFWESEEAIRAFAGDDISVAKY